MAKLIYSVSMSLDGYIAGPGGDMSWLTDHLGPNPPVEELMTQIGALLIGRTTFGGDDPHRGTEKEGKAFGGGWEGPAFVLTHRPPDDPVPGMTFVTDLADAIQQSSAAAGDGYVNVMGASVGRQCLEAGALDEILVCISPLLLGDGTRLFDHPGGTNIRLERIALHELPHTTVERFRVLR
jgi:dihydrofolate reductase